MKFEDLLFEMTPMVEKKATDLIKEGKIDEAKQLLTDHTHNFATATMKRWEELKAELWTIFARSM